MSQTTTARQTLAPEPASAPRALFRQEALQFQDHDRQWGQVVSLHSVSASLMVWLIMFAVAGVVAFLWFAEYARKETAIGYLEPLGGTVKVMAGKPGFVSAVYVEQGQTVQRGQALLQITTSQIGSNGEDIDSIILGTLTAQRETLLRQIAAEEKHETSEHERLIAQRRATEMELRFFGEELITQQQRVRVGELLLGTATTLSQKGLMTEVEQHRREDSLLEQKQHLSTLTEGVVTRQGKITELDFNIAQLPTIMATKLQPLRSELSNVDQRVAEIKGRRAYVVRAPLSGRITALQASLGQTVDTQHAQMQILGDGKLHGRLFIPAHAIGFVHVGQEVRIHYDAFPYTNYGTYSGHIDTLSETMLAATDSTGPITLKEPCYHATVSLDRLDVDASGRRVPLQPDMTLRGDVILDRHTLMVWIFRPAMQVLRFGR